MRKPLHRDSGPAIYYLCARRAGPVAGWDAWLERARTLGCDWLWLGGLQPRAAAAHAFAVDEPGALADAVGSEGEFADFVARVHAAGLKLATDVAPAFAARNGRFVRAHPDWMVRGPAGTPAIPAGMPGGEGTLAECDFGGTDPIALIGYWADILSRIAARGFDAIVGRAAHRVPAAAWSAILAPARRGERPLSFWAETLGAPVAAAEALAPVGVDAFFSSVCWWDFRADWFLEQEARLRRLAPTIGFPEEPGGPRLAAAAAVGEAEAEAGFRYRLVAATAWGVVLPMGYALGWREPLGESGIEEPTRFDLTAELGDLNRVRAGSSALTSPGRLARLSAPGARAVALARFPTDDAAQPALLVANPERTLHAELAAGPLFPALDAASAAAREITPGRSPQALDPVGRLALEPRSVRWFELRAGDARAPRSDGSVPVPPSGGPAAQPIAIENVRPVVAAGRFPVKRLLGESVEVSADLLTEGHGRVAAAVRYRADDGDWREIPLEPAANDRWRARFAPASIGVWRFQIVAWRDRFSGWREDCIKRRDAGQPLAPELGEGEALLAEAAENAVDPGMREHLRVLRERLAAHGDETEARADLLLGATTAELVVQALPRSGQSVTGQFEVLVERGRAGQGAWYECFPRSLGRAGRHGSFGDLIAHLPYVAELGFDVLYLPPIHPIGHTNRKGRNNSLEAGLEDPGSPWAIGAETGGHTALHPALGTLEDFRRLLAAARALGLEIALDFAIQCSPDHPWIDEHPDWFRWRPDGTIRYAENPPKKYEDIVNVDFFGAGRETLWQELAGVLLFWCAQGVRLFRVDNPHTKPLPFWEWVLRKIRADYPDTVFLAEAFTRPKLMYQLAKLGFSQSYTYFTWRNTKSELTDYLIELAQEPQRDYFRPNFWVNTPDINPYYLQQSGRAGFVIRAVLAATMAASWGMYSGYELCEAEPLRNPDGSPREEYVDSEKYEFKHRDFDAPGNIRGEIAALNRIRRDNPALRTQGGIGFHRANDDAVLFYSRSVPDNVLWILVSLDPHNAHEADLELPLEMIAAADSSSIEVEELLRGVRWVWYGRHQRVRLDPDHPAMVLRVSRND